MTCIAKIATCISFLCVVTNTWSQREADTWYFGKYRGLDFSSGVLLTFHHPTFFFF